MNAVCQQLADRVRDVAAFCIERGGECFKDWPDSKVFRFAAWHALNGTLFVAFDAAGKLGMVVICWLANAADVQAKALTGEPDFDWYELPKNGDSILVADMIGNRKFLADIVKQINGVWPDSPGKRLLTYRRNRLVEVSWSAIHRLAR